MSCRPKTKAPSQLMFANIQRTLSLFFAIEQKAIDCDLRNADNLKEETQSLLNSLPPGKRTAEKEARLAHLFLVQAHEYCRNDSSSELKVYHATSSGFRIMLSVDLLASDKGRLAELMEAMGVIECREGVDGWMPGDGPDDYRRLSDEFESLSQNQADTVFLFILRRYRFDDCANLFEEDRVEFEFQREVGRRVTNGDTPILDAINPDRWKFKPEMRRRLELRIRELRQMAGETP